MFNFAERKILIRLAQQDFPIGHMTSMLNHVTWSRDQTGYKNPVLNHNFDELAPIY